jgi:hypothetical protein
VCHGRAPGCITRQLVCRIRLQRKNIVKKVVGEAEKGELSDNKAENCEPRRGPLRIRIGESAFMLQPWSLAESEVGFQ